MAHRDSARVILAWHTRLPRYRARGRHIVARHIETLPGNGCLVARHALEWNVAHLRRSLDVGEERDIRGSWLAWGWQQRQQNTNHPGGSVRKKNPPPFASLFAENTHHLWRVCSQALPGDLVINFCCFDNCDTEGHWSTPPSHLYPTFTVTPPPQG
eukprot:gene5958-biopygen5632